MSPVTTLPGFQDREGQHVRACTEMAAPARSPEHQGAGGMREGQELTRGPLSFPGPGFREGVTPSLSIADKYFMRM